MNLSTLPVLQTTNTAAQKKPAGLLIRSFIGFFMLMLLNSTMSFGQTTGDFRSNGTPVDLTTITNWQTWNGGAWVTATVPPNGNLVSGNTVTILTGHTWNNAGPSPTIPSGVTVIHQGTTGTHSTAAGNKINNNGTYIHNTVSSNSTVLAGMNNNTGSTVIFRGSSTTVVSPSISGRTFYNFTIESTSGAMTTATAAGAAALIVNGNMNIGGTGAGTVVCDQSGATMTLTIGGNFSTKASCTYKPPTGALTFSGNITNAGTFTLNSTASVTFDGATTLSGANLVSFANGFTVNATKSFANSQNGNIVAAGKTATINGTFQVNEGSWTGSTGTYSYGAASTLIFNNSTGPYGPIDNTHLYWPSANPPFNVTVQNTGGINLNVARTVGGIFQTSTGVTGSNNLTLNGTGKLNTGGFLPSIPVWGASSTLIYNTGGTFGRGNEFPNSGNVPSNVQVSGNTTLNYPNAGLAARTLTGNLTIDAGSAFYMDFGSPNPGVGLLTINNLVLDGNLSLGSQPGGDLAVKGNFTRTGTFAPVSRAVFFNAASGNQTLTGSTGFDYVIVDKAAGSVVLANNMTVNQVITLTNGTVNTGASKVNVTNGATNAVVRTNGYVNGNLQRAINTGANTYDYFIGTAAGYTPASFAFTAVGTGGSILLSSADAVGTNYPASLNATKRLARNWTAVNSGVAGITGSATFTYLPADLVGGAVAANLKAYVYDGATGYPTSTGTTANSFTFNGLTTVGEFGAGECKGTLAPTFVKTQASSCGGGADGSITVTPAGGTGPYTYSWSSNPAGFSGNTAAVTGLSPRDYTVVVTEVTTCSSSIPNITIFQVAAPTVSNNGTQPSSCANDGSIIIYGANGIPPYTYSVDGTNYFPSNTFTGLGAATYTAYVKDSKNCVGTKTNITLTAAPAIVVTSYATAASSCANNGSIQLFRTGGVAPYMYSLDDVTYQSSNTFSGLVGNTTYTGWVRDSKGCKTSLPNIAVGKAPAVTASEVHTNASACANDGTIKLTGGGGVPGYTYSITGAGGPYQAGNTFTGLAAGSYTGWVQDSKGCKNSVAVTVGSTAAIVVTASASDAGGCNNAGKIQLFLTGGTGPYMYSLDNVNYFSSNTFTNLPSGTYTGYVKDSKTCVGSLANITVTQNTPAVSVTESHTSSSTCVNDGTIQLRPAGGTVPYTYSLDNITYQAGTTFTGLAAGSYTGWIKDANGCTSSVGITIGSNPIVVTAYATNATACELSNGSIQLFRSGGTGPYTYSLDNITYVAGNTFTGLTAGTYTGYVKDSKGCIGSLANITVGPNCAPPFAGTHNNTNAAGKIPVSTVLKVQAYPNPSAGEFTLQLEGFSNDKLSIMVTDVMGKVVYKTESTNKQSIRFGNNLMAGIYLVQVVQGTQKQSIKIIKE